MRILIDNGHGENTPGKRSPDGKLREWEYTRRIADMVIIGLRNKGIDAERTVKEMVDIPLSVRCRRANTIYRETGGNAILVSIHCNAAGSGIDWMQAKGWSAYTSKGSTKADVLASCLYASAAECFPAGTKIRSDWSDKDSDWEENFYILQKTKCPAVLTENFFQDNKEDVEFLLSADGKARIVKAHAIGIANYLKV